MKLCGSGVWGCIVVVSGGGCMVVVRGGDSIPSSTCSFRYGTFSSNNEFLNTFELGYYPVK